MTLHDYAMKWDRPYDNSFAAACYAHNTIAELVRAYKSVDQTDMRVWDLRSDDEYREAIEAAIQERFRDDTRIRAGDADLVMCLFRNKDPENQ